jgi:uncharacterized membrane protein YjjB (DUF3815 family)
MSPLRRAVPRQSSLALTGWLSRRHKTHAVSAAVATITLMCTDAWFDLCTSAPGSPFAYAAVEAVAELAMAAGCLAIGLRSRRMQPPTSVGKALHNAS